MRTIPYILEDTIDFLSRPHDEGVRYMGEFIDKQLDKKVSTESLKTLAEIILSENFFESGDKIYHQKLGAAIDTKFALPYANLFMAGFESKMFPQLNFEPYLWLHFLDDNFCIWTLGLQKLQAFFKALNSSHPTIKITTEHSTSQINFLDVTITKKPDGKLICSVRKLIRINYCTQNHAIARSLKLQFLMVKLSV